MLRKLLTWFLLLGATLAVSACCVNNTCFCRDNNDDVVFFRFTLGPGQFSAAEVDTVYIQRKALDPKSAFKGDSIRIIRTPANAGDSLVLGPTGPFTALGVRFTNYQYTIRLTHPVRRFVIDSLRVEGRFESESGCCTCYRNLRKSLRVNGVRYDAYDPTGEDKPVYIPLSKP
ncbi:hypothetical protein [Hymenobacter elongatus]|uniref:Lipoprotein n=1 Tax=Hymenobacter elongatus TaxID=877208 RepID=A0A4Z0PLA9_9BACT|nr:hypothetical protein [Hymenobacter elongatus]TGE16805.1 hypothetical protein E5J99_08835 [Hymenobacter elongatus]